MRRCVAGVGLAGRAVPADDVVEQRAGRRLAALVQPQAGQHGAEIRPPDAGDGRGSADSAMRQVEVPAISAEMPVESPASPAKAAEHAERAGMGVDQPGADAACVGQAERRGRVGA